MKLNRVDKDKTYRENAKKNEQRNWFRGKEKRWVQRVFNGDKDSRKKSSNKLRTHFQRREYLKWKTGKEIKLKMVTVKVKKNDTDTYTLWQKSRY